MPQVDSHTYTLTTSTDLAFADAVDGFTASEEHRNLGGAGRGAERRAGVLLDRDLAGGVGEAELGHPLAYRV